MPDIFDVSVPHQPSDEWVRLGELGAAELVGVGLFGVVSKRKGLKTFLKVAEKLKGTQFRFSLTGKILGSEVSTESTEVSRKALKEGESANVAITNRANGDEQTFGWLIAGCSVILRSTILLTEVATS